MRREGRHCKDRRQRRRYASHVSGACVRHTSSCVLHISGKTIFLCLLQVLQHPLHSEEQGFKTIHKTEQDLQIYLKPGVRCSQMSLNIVRIQRLLRGSSQTPGAVSLVTECTTGVEKFSESIFSLHIAPSNSSTQLQHRRSRKNNDLCR